MKTIDSIDTYMDEIRKFNRITPAQETSLGLQMANGTPEERMAARDQLICANLRLVVKIAHDFKCFNVSFQDLVAVGNTGLVTAAEKFDPTVGAKFSCYAAWWIKQAMRKHILWHSRVIRIPGGSAQLMLSIEKARARLHVEFGREPTVEELADATRLSPERITSLTRNHVETFSMDDKVSPDSDTTFEQMMSSDDEYSAEDELSAKVNRELLHGAIRKLTDMEQFIVSSLFGIDAVKLEMREVAQLVGHTVAWVTAKLSKILEKLRGMLQADLLEFA